jgi:threonine dehydrogenase-like Zn-dependent dehydrogenase
MGVNELQVQTVPDPAIVNPHDAILKVRLTTTCGSDLHLLGGYIPTMREGDVIGYEHMGEIVEAGPQTTRLKPGDRVVVPSFFGCGKCWDAVPTGYMGADFCEIQPGDTSQSGDAAPSG